MVRIISVLLLVVLVVATVCGLRSRRQIIGGMYGGMGPYGMMGGYPMMGGYMPGYYGGGMMGAQSSGSSFSSQSMSSNTGMGGMGVGGMGIGGMGGMGMGGMYGGGMGMGGMGIGMYPYSGFAQSLQSSFSSFNNQFSSGFMSRSKGSSSGHGDNLLNETTKAFVDVAGHIGEPCFYRLLCNVGVRSEQYGKFGELVIEFFSTSMDNEIQKANFGPLHTAYKSGIGASQSFCTKEYAGCEISTAEIMKTVNSRVPRV